MQLRDSQGDMGSNWSDSIVDVMFKHSVDRPDATVYRFLRNGEYETDSLTYREFADSVLHVATHLHDVKLSGQRALLLFNSGLDYLVALFACFSAGVIAIPAFPPRSKRTMPRIEAIVADADAMVVLTTSALKENLISYSSGDIARVTWMATDAIAPTRSVWPKPIIGKDSIAYLQYTSGSTGSPKGVVVTHGNIMHNVARISEQFAQNENSGFVSWLPLFHDLGLIFGALVPMYVGASCTLMSPAAFLQRPYRWLKAISDYKATTSGAPNFAYELCVQRIPPNIRAHLDLRSWSIALNGAEPVRAATLERFSNAFAVSGFESTTHKPSYGLAEATLVVSCTTSSDSARSLDVSPEKLEMLGEAVPMNSDHSRRMVSSGRAFPDQSVIIVDPQSCRVLADRHVGEIWVSGDSVAHGYWCRQEESAAVFGAVCSDFPGRRFLRTGDLGFFDQKELYIAGRLKDVVILHGRNLYPQDIESVVENSHASLKLAGTAAFSLEVDSNEQLVVVAELVHKNKAESTDIVDAIRQAVSETFDVRVYAIELIKAGTLPKTSSGKVQRHYTRQLFEQEKLSSIHRWIGDEVTIGTSLTAGDAHGLLTREISKILKIDSSELDSCKPLTAMGMDSLSAAALAESIEAHFGIHYPIGDLFGGMTLEKLVSTLPEGNDPEMAVERIVG